MFFCLKTVLLSTIQKNHEYSTITTYFFYFTKHTQVLLPGLLSDLLPGDQALVQHDARRSTSVKNSRSSSNKPSTLS